MTTTVRPASRSASTTGPSGRSMATSLAPVLASRRTRSRSPAAGRAFFVACCISASSLLVPVGRPPIRGAGTRLPVRSLFGARRRSALSTVGASRVTTRASQNSSWTSRRRASRAMARWHRGASATSFSSPTSIGCTGEHRSGPGRPPAITRQVGRWIVALAKLPYSFGEICRRSGVSYSVYKRVRQDYPGFAAVLTYARTVRIARIAEAREQAIQVAVATGDWRAIEQVYLDEVRRMARERAEDPWADPEQLAEAIAERLREMVGGDGAAGPAGGVRGAPGPEPEPAAAVADERTGDALHRP